MFIDIYSFMTTEHNSFTSCVSSLKEALSTLLCLLIFPQGSRLSCGMRALITTAVRTSGVTSVSLRYTRWDGVLLVANPSYLRKVSPVPNFFTVLLLNASFLGWVVVIVAVIFVISLTGIQHKYSNWKAFLVKRLTGAKTLPPDFNDKVGHTNA